MWNKNIKSLRDLTFDAVLSGFRLLLSIAAYDRHHGHVHDAEVLRPHSELQLAQSLHEGHGLDVSDGAAQLDHAHLRNCLRNGSGFATAYGLRSDVHDALDYFIRYVRNDLDSLPEEFSSSLFGDNCLIDFAGG